MQAAAARTKRRPKRRPSLRVRVQLPNVRIGLLNLFASRATGAAGHRRRPHAQVLKRPAAAKPRRLLARHLPGAAGSRPSLGPAPVISRLASSWVPDSATLQAVSMARRAWAPRFPAICVVATRRYATALLAAHGKAALGSIRIAIRSTHPILATARPIAFGTPGIAPVFRSATSISRRSNATPSSAVSGTATFASATPRLAKLGVTRAAARRTAAVGRTPPTVTAPFLRATRM